MRTIILLLLSITLVYSNALGFGPPYGANPFLGAVGESAPVAPTLSSWTVLDVGNLSDLEFSEAMEFGTGGSGGFTTNTPTWPYTYVSGSGTNTIRFSHSIIYSDATDNPTGDFVQPTDGWQSVSGGVDLASFTGATVTNNSTQTPGTVLLEDDFEGANGTPITTYGNGWTAEGTDPGNLIEISTTKAQAGSSSMKMVGGTSIRTATNSFTEQDNSVFTTTYYINIDSFLGNSPNIDLADGTTPAVTLSVRYGTDYRLQYFNGSTFTDFSTPSILTPNTWYKVEIESNLNTDTFSVWVADSSVESGIAMRGTGLLIDNVKAKVFNTGINFLYVDNLEVRTGAR